MSRRVLSAAILVVSLLLAVVAIRYAATLYPSPPRWPDDAGWLEGELERRVPAPPVSSIT